MGGHFLDKKTQQKIVLLCAEDVAAKNCKRAYFSLVTPDSVEFLHQRQALPMLDSDQAHYRRYGMFYVIRDNLILSRQIGPQPWVIWNGMRISSAFRKAVRIMFSKDPNDFEKSIRLSHGNFKKLIEVIGRTY